MFLAFSHLEVWELNLKCLEPGVTVTAATPTAASVSRRCFILLQKPAGPAAGGCEGGPVAAGVPESRRVKGTT